MHRGASSVCSFMVNLTPTMLRRGDELNDATESIKILSERLEKMDEEMSEFAAKVARWKSANSLILQAIHVAIKEIDPSVAGEIPRRLELIRSRTNGDPILFEAIEDALQFFRS